MDTTGNVVSIEPLALNVRSAAAYIGVGRTKIFELIAEGKIDARKAGTRTLVTVASLKAYLASLPPVRGVA